MTSANNPGNDTCDKEKIEGCRQPTFMSRKTPQTKIHLKADCQVPTWSTTTWSTTITRDAHFAEVRCATRGTGCFSIDSLCIGHFTTRNLERKGHRAQGIRRQVNRTLSIHKESITEEYLVRFGIVHEDAWSDQQNTAKTRYQ